MKDQLRLLRDCINNDRPAVVFQGDDFCAPEILEAAKEIYRKHGCSEEFLFDWQLLINEVKAYQLESPATVKLPKLSPTETELVREEMTKRKKIFSFNTHLLFFRQRIERDGIKMLANLLFSKVPANS